MWPDRVSNPGPLTYESGALPTALRGPAVTNKWNCMKLNMNICHHYAPMPIKFCQNDINKLSHNYVSSGQNFLKLVMNLYVQNFDLHEVLSEWLQ